MRDGLRLQCPKNLVKRANYSVHHHCMEIEILKEIISLFSNLRDDDDVKII